MTERFYVVKTRECYEKLTSERASMETCDDLAEWNNGLRCDGCLRDGTAVDLGTRIQVAEFSPLRWWPSFDVAAPTQKEENER